MMISNLVSGDAIPLTGNSGLMMKNWLVSFFSVPYKVLPPTFKFCLQSPLPIVALVVCFLSWPFVMDSHQL
jgi:hypothetical protein